MTTKNTLCRLHLRVLFHLLVIQLDYFALIVYCNSRFNIEARLNALYNSCCFIIYAHKYNTYMEDHYIFDLLLTT